MEVDELPLQDLTSEWTKPILEGSVKWKVERCKSLMIFGLEEVHIPTKEEMIVMGEFSEDTDVVNAISEIKETKRIRKYYQDKRE